MRRSFFPLFIGIAVLLSAGGFVMWNLFSPQRQLHKIEIPEAYLETTDTSRFSVTPLTINRTFPDDSVLVFFPKQKSSSHIYLYDQANYNRLLFGDHHAVPVFLPDYEGMKAMFGRSVLNLSGMPEGKYYVHVTACSFGGFLQFSIKDSLQ
ncbi:MAG: hypothetical protein M3R17_18830 [Bacteroidota bacterium]|nr:hypothetical protein [Bacteroidota bacterium]